MDKRSGGNFVLGVCGGIIFGALIDNMAIGLLLGFAVGFGLVKFNGGKSKAEAAVPTPSAPDPAETPGTPPSPRD